MKAAVYYGPNKLEIDDNVVNLREAGGVAGEEVRRVRRVSIVFVSKLS